MATTRNVPRTWGERRDALLRGLRDTRSELQKVTWPSRQETTNLTLVVIGVSAVLGLLLGGIDLVLTRAFEWLTATFSGVAGA
jgi:preprotein translocase subunit SecE